MFSCGVDGVRVVMVIGEGEGKNTKALEDRRNLL